MKRAIIWSRDALDDLKQQIAHIAADDPAAARRVIDKITTVAADLGHFATGRPGRVLGTYEKSIVGLPFVIAYSLAADNGRENVAILRVIHTSRNWLPDNWPERA